MDETSLPLPPVRCLSKEQAAIYLGIGVTLLAQLEVPHVRLGRRCVYDRLDLDAWLDEHKGECVFRKSLTIVPVIADHSAAIDQKTSRPDKINLSRGV